MINLSKNRATQSTPNWHNFEILMPSEEYYYIYVNSIYIYIYFLSIGRGKNIVYRITIIGFTVTIIQQGLNT